MGRWGAGTRLGVVTMETEVQITLIFLGAGLLAYVIIPGMLVIWDRVLDHMGNTGTGEQDKKV
jgi:hypothetical protein